MLKGMKPVAFPPHPSHSVEGSEPPLPQCLLWLAGWPSAGQAQAPLERSPGARGLLRVGTFLTGTLQRG